MKKLITTTVVTGLISSNLFAFDIGSILGKYNPLDQLNNVSGTEAFGMCYKRKSFTVEICSALPELGNFGLDGCSVLPNIAGFDKRTNNFDLNGNDFLKSYCLPAAKKINSVISDIDLATKDVMNGKKPLPNGKTINEYYDGAVKNIVGKPSVINAHFTSNNQRVTKEILNTASSNESLGKDLSKVKVSDIQATVPKDYKEYQDQSKVAATILNRADIINTPVQVSGALGTKLKGKEGASAKNTAENYIEQATSSINDTTEQKVQNAIDLQRKDTDLAIPTQDSIDIYREDLKPEKVALLKDQLRREAKIRADVEMKDKLRTDIVALLGQKAVIMNEKFDRAAARDEIEALIK